MRWRSGVVPRPTAEISRERSAPFRANAIHERCDLVQERVAIERGRHIGNWRRPIVDLLADDRCTRKARSSAYLADILGRIRTHDPKHLDEMLPWTWKTAREAERKAA